MVFPTASRRTIAKEVTEVLLKGNALYALFALPSQRWSHADARSIPTIKSNVNVKVLMECVGQCFGLPIHDCAGASLGLMLGGAHEARRHHRCGD